MTDVRIVFNVVKYFLGLGFAVYLGILMLCTESFRLCCGLLVLYLQSRSCSITIILRNLHSI